MPERENFQTTFVEKKAGPEFWRPAAVLKKTKSLRAKTVIFDFFTVPGRAVFCFIRTSSFSSAENLACIVRLRFQLSAIKALFSFADCFKSF